MLKDARIKLYSRGYIARNNGLLDTIDADTAASQVST